MGKVRTEMRPKANFCLLIESVDSHACDSILRNVVVTHMKTHNVNGNDRSQLSRHTREVCGIQQVVYANYSPLLGIDRFYSHHVNIIRHPGLVE